MSSKSDPEQLRKRLRILASQLETSEKERATLEDMAEAAAILRERYQAERDQAMRERDLAQAQYYMAEEHERRRLSELLHDSAGQYITAIRQYAALIKKRAGTLETNDASAERIARDAQKIIEFSSYLNDATREVLHAQWPDSLEREGLHAALRELVAFWRASAPSMTITTELEPIPAFDNAIFVYRIAQEWLNNVQRHGQAAHLVVRLSRHTAAGAPETGRLQCADDGVGFDPAHATGRGLHGIRERARSLGATLSIDSAPGEGATLTLDFPTN